MLCAAISLPLKAQPLANSRGCATSSIHRRDMSAGRNRRSSPPNKQARSGDYRQKIQHFGQRGIHPRQELRGTLQERTLSQAAIVDGAKLV